MTDKTTLTHSETIGLEDLNSDFLTLRIGEEIPRLQIRRIRKVTNTTKPDNLPGVDYKYIIETKDNKILTVNSWVLWKAIAAALREAGRMDATLYLKHNNKEDYTVKLI